MKQAIIENNEIKIKFYTKDSNEFHSILDSVKTIPGRYFIASDKVWKCPKTSSAIKTLKVNGFAINDISVNTEIINIKPEIITPLTLNQKYGLL